MAPRPRSLPRSLQIILGVTGFFWFWLRRHRHSPQQLPDRLRATLEGLGITFVAISRSGHP